MDQILSSNQYAGTLLHKENIRKHSINNEVGEQLKWLII